MASNLTDEMSSFEAVTWCFHQAADHLSIDEELQALMRHPWRELTVSVPIRLDNGNVVQTAQTEKLSLRGAAFVIDVGRVAEAIRLRGFV